MYVCDGPNAERNRSTLSRDQSGGKWNANITIKFVGTPPPTCGRFTLVRA